MTFSGKAQHEPRAALPAGADDISDLVGLIAPFDTPLLDAIGDPRREASSTRHEWSDGHNYTKIFIDSSMVSSPMDGAALEKELDYQVIQRLREQMRALENACINGTGTHVSGRELRGILNYAPTRDAGGMLLTATLLDMCIRELRDIGGTPDTIVCSGFQKRKISSFTKTRRGGFAADRYNSDGGSLRIILSRWVPADRVLLLDCSKLQVVPLAGRSFHATRELTESSAKARVVGEYTLEVSGWHYAITNLASA